VKGVTGVAHPWMSATPGDPACLEHARAHLEPVYTWFRAQPAKTSPLGPAATSPPGGCLGSGAEEGRGKLR
jgi:hypothetical protein